MTRYEQGFLTKCAEYGLDAGTSMKLMEKSALNWKMLGAYAKDIARHPVKAGRRWWELMRGGQKAMQQKAFDFRKALSALDRDNTLSLTDRIIRKNQLAEALKNDKAFMNEAKKVIGTRLGTATGATALGGGVYAAARGGRNRGNSGGGDDRILGNYSKLMEPTDGNHRILGNYANLIG